MHNLYKKFLDKYVGDTFTVVKSDTSRFTFSVISNRGEIVLHFKIRFSFNTEEYIFNLFRGNELCTTISAAFGLDDDEAMRVVRDWFGDILLLKKVSDLSSFISEEDMPFHKHWDNPFI